MPRHARIHFVSNKSSLVNLPISLYGPLLERNIRPQNVAVVLSKVGQSPKKDIYVGWTGMLAASSVARFSGSSFATAGDSETVEIDPQFAAGLGLSQGDTVEIGLAHDLPRAKMVTTEPLTADDWEIIELHSEHVESTFLSQVRVATLGQELDVWVHGATRVRLRATALDPLNAKALLLTTDTELSIAPKTHARPASSAKVSEPAVSKSLSTPSPAVATSKPQFALTAILRVLPSTLISRLPHAGEEPVACVSSSLLASLPPGSFNALIRVLRAPPDPEDSPTSTPAPEAKLLELGRPSTSNEGKPDTAKDEQRSMPIVPLSEVPEGQIVLVGGATRAGSDGEPAEWDRLLLSILPASRNPEPTPELVHRATKSPIHSLAGVDAVLKASGDYCKAAFALSRSGRPSGLPALLITGRSGSGKTEVARAVARGMQYDGVHAYVRYVDLARYKERPARSLRELFVAWRDAVAWRGPGVLILDNLEAILGVEAEHADSFRTRHATEAFLSVFARQPVPNVLIIGTTQSDASLHLALGAAHVFKKTVALRAPDKDARKMILEQSLRQRLASAQSLLLDDAQAPNALALATQTEGYSATDLRDLVGRAVHVAAARSAADSQPSDRATLKMQDFTEAQEGFVPRALRDVPLQTSTVAWTDIGGLNDTRRVLRETLEWPTKYAAIFKQSPLRLRSGLLLYGYPGCGKTMLASAVARECGLNFISVKGPELLNKYIGASEKSVRDVFERASAAKPCVLFFDEFDSIAPKRGHDSTGVTDRVVNQLLTLMDGAEGLDGVYVLAATSRPDLIDSALLRPGRLDKALLCNMPSAAERKEILEAHALKVPVHNIVDFTWVADATEGFSGADLQALIYNAHLALVHADIGAHASLDDKAQDSGEQRVEFVRFGGRQGDSGLKSRAEELELQRRIQRMMSLSGQGEVDTNAKKAPVHEPVKHEITDVHLRSALKDARPSVAKEEVARLSRIYSAFVDGRTGEMPVPPEAGGIGQRATLM